MNQAELRMAHLTLEVHRLKAAAEKLLDCWEHIDPITGDGDALATAMDELALVCSGKDLPS